MSEPTPGAMLTVTEAPPLTLVEVHTGTGVHGDVAAALGCTLPAPGEVAAAGDGVVLGLTADSWLLAGNDPDTAVRAVHAAAQDALAVDQTHGWQHLRLAGTDPGAVLSGLTGVDLSPAGLPPGRCAQTMLGHHPVIAWRHDDDTLNVLTPRSYADSLCDLLAEAR